MRRFRKLMPRRILDEPVMPIGRLRDTKQLLQQQVHAGRPEQVPAPHHVGNALQGVVDHDGQMIARRRLLARQDDVAPGLGLCGRRRRVSPPGPSPILVQAQFPGARAAPPPCRAAARKARLARSAARAGPATAISRRPDRAAPRRDRAAMARRPRAARPAGRFPRGSRSSDRSGPGLPIFRPPPDSAQNAPIAAAPAFPRISRARRGLRRSPPRIPAGIAWRRYPRSAAGICRRRGAPGRNSAAPNRRGRDGGSRSGSAQIGKRVAALHTPSLPGLTRQSIVQEPFTI